MRRRRYGQWPARWKSVATTQDRPARSWSTLLVNTELRGGFRWRRGKSFGAHPIRTRNAKGSNAYGFGQSEQLLSAALPRVPREQVIIATNLGVRSSDGGPVRNSSAGWIRKGLDASLRALDTDYVDLYQVHWWSGRRRAGYTDADMVEAVHRKLAGG